MSLIMNSVKMRAISLQVGDVIVGWYPERRFEKIERVSLVSKKEVEGSRPGTTAWHLVFSDASEMTVRPFTVFALEVPGRG
jgi:hypothetical protein